MASAKLGADRQRYLGTSTPGLACLSAIVQAHSNCSSTIDIIYIEPTSHTNPLEVTQI